MSINNSNHAGGSRGVKRLHSCVSEVTLSSSSSGEFSRSKDTDDISTERSKMHSRLRASKSESDLTRQPKRQRLSHSRDFWRETSRRLQETLDGRAFQFHPQANPYKIYHRFSLPADLKLNTNFTNSNANTGTPPSAHHSTQNPEKSPFCFGSESNKDSNSERAHTAWYEILDLSSYRDKKADSLDAESDTDLKKEESSDKSNSAAERAKENFNDINDIVITESVFAKEEEESSVADLDFYSLMNLYDGYLYRYQIKKVSTHPENKRHSLAETNQTDADMDTTSLDMSNLTICDDDIENYMRRYDVNAEDVQNISFGYI